MLRDKVKRLEKELEDVKARAIFLPEEHQLTAQDIDSEP